MSFLFTILLFYLMLLFIKWLVFPLFKMRNIRKRYEQQYKDENDNNNNTNRNKNTKPIDNEGTIPDDFGEYTDYEELK